MNAPTPNRHFLFLTIEREIGMRGSDREVPNLDSLQKRRKHRTDETHEATRRINL